jgi:hypothetical protein
LARSAIAKPQKGLTFDGPACLAQATGQHVLPQGIAGGRRLAPPRFRFLAPLLLVEDEPKPVHGIDVALLCRPPQPELSVGEVAVLPSQNAVIGHTWDVALLRRDVQPGSCLLLVAFGRKDGSA